MAWSFPALDFVKVFFQFLDFTDDRPEAPDIIGKPTVQTRNQLGQRLPVVQCFLVFRFRNQMLQFPWRGLQKCLAPGDLLRQVGREMLFGNVQEFRKPAHGGDRRRR